MSTTEAELLSRHEEALKEGREACRLLGLNADPEYLAPRGRNYGNLKRALKALEGSARQMNYHRSDTRWVKVGIFYGQMIHSCQHLFANQDWLGFRRLMPIFDRGLKGMQQLANMRTGKSGPILPTRPANWLIIPDQTPIRPKRFMMNSP